jgi:hypothetical protein
MEAARSEALRTIFDALARQFEFPKLNQAKEDTLIQVIAPTVPPTKTPFPK